MSDAASLGLIAPPPADSPRILLYDIETTPALCWMWHQFQANVVATEIDWRLLCFAYRWLGQSETGFVSVFQDPHFKPDRFDDKWVAKRLAALFDLADCTIAHNGDKFDRRKANARFLYWNLPIPSPYVTIDTKKESARYFANYSNSLNELGRLLGLGEKEHHTGFDLWRRCMAGDPQAWVDMERYNLQDLDLLEALYLRLLPWIGTPGAGGGSLNRALWSDEEWTCPKCGGHRFQMRGRHRTRFSTFQVFCCKSCGGYSRKPFREKGHASAI
jgi:hypothetical protein